MAFIRKKSKKGQDYYWIVESYRVGTKVRQRNLEYIGTVDELMKLALKGWKTENEKDTESMDKGLSFKAYIHGSCYALFLMAQLIGIEEILDKTLPPKTVRGMKRSRVLLLAMIHRAIDPQSKRAFAGWANETSLPYHLKFDAENLTSQAFWEAMDGISEEDMNQANRAICVRVMEMAGVNPRTFHLDYTNYYTFIDSKNGRCVICKRGHNKQKRDDLRQFSLAMLTSYLMQVPIIWQLYEGNKNDKQEFPDFTKFVTEELRERGIDPAEVTITFDGGSNSEENFKDLEFSFICSASLSENKELYDIDLDEYGTVDLGNGHSRLAYRVDNITFNGISGTGILTYSEALERGQVAELDRKIEKLRKVCDELNEKLTNTRTRIFTALRKRKKEVEQEIKEVNEYNRSIGPESRKKKKPIPVWDELQEISKILNDKAYESNHLVKEFTSLTIKSEGGTYHISLNVDEGLKRAYIRKYYGKKFTCTNVRDWTTEKILREYCEQECIETNIFKVSKDCDHFSVRPQFHWTDDKIRVHTFICLTSMVIAEMLRMRFEEKGIKETKAALLDKLTAIHDGWIFKDEKKVERSVESLDKEKKELWDVVENMFDELGKVKNA